MPLTTSPAPGTPTATGSTEPSHEAQFRQLVLDAICGVGLPTLHFAAQMEEMRLAKRVFKIDDERGTYYMPVWDVAVLSRLNMVDLQGIYALACQDREELFTPTDPVDDFVKENLHAD